MHSQTSTSTRYLLKPGLVLAMLFAALFAASVTPAFAAAATVTAVTPSNGTTAGGTAIVLTGTGFGTSGTPLVTAVTVGGTPATTFAVVNDTTLNVTTPAHAAGLVDIVVTTDVANANTAGDNFTYYATPAVTGVSPLGGVIGGGTSVTIAGSGFTGATGVTFGGAAGSGLVVTNDNSITVTSPAHAAGLVDVLVSNPVATSANTAADNFRYGTTTPSVVSLTPTTGPIVGGTVVTVTGTGFTGATGVTFGGTAGTALTITSDTSLTVTSPGHLAGVADVIVTTPSGASPNTSADNYTYGTVLPSVTSLSPTGGPIGGGTSVTITGTGFTGATLVTFGGTAGSSLVVVNDTTITVTAPAHVAGVVDVLVSNPSGTSNNTGADNYTYGAAGPTVTAVSPTTGPTVGGNTVTITGTGFTGATGVSFGGNAGTGLVVVNDTQITVTAPAHSAATVDVIVTTGIGPSANTAADNYTYSTAPFITSVSPAGGPIAGGTSVFITGVNFTGTTAVTFGGTAATSFTVNSSTQITATAPAHAAGSVNIVVTSPNGSNVDSSTDDYIYGTGPTITAISPSSGPTTGGTTVTITGTGFTGATAVKFGTIAATSFTVVSDTSITAVSPAQANSVVQISVTTPVGTTADVAADNFTYGTGSTVSFTLYFRWTLIVWNGKDNADITLALKGQENPDNPNTNDVSSSVTAIFHYNNPLQKFEGFFPGSAGVPGANDFTTFKKGEAYWIAISSTGSLTWTTLAD
ncbi:MAG: IPT/TIG domain-containing protein [bacterium]